MKVQIILATVPSGEDGEGEGDYKGDIKSIQTLPYVVWPSSARCTSLREGASVMSQPNT